MRLRNAMATQHVNGKSSHHVQNVLTKNRNSMTCIRNIIIGCVTSIAVLALQNQYAISRELTLQKFELGGYLAWFKCIARIEGPENAQSQLEAWNKQISINASELEDELTLEIADIIYRNTGLVSKHECPNASEITAQEEAAIKSEIQKLLSR